MKKVKANLNHTGAHLLAAAVLTLYPNTKIGFGPSIDEGFYYDFKFEKSINNDDLKRIEKQMVKIVLGKYKMVEVSKIVMSHQPYKQELIQDLKQKKEKITYWGMLNPSSKKSIFTDVCKGDHVESVDKLQHFKLLHFSGTYWKGNSQNDQLTRIYGIAWETSEELKQYLAILEERKERDHRKIGKEANIFMLNYLSGQGFPIFLEDGMIIKKEIQKYVRKIEEEVGFKEVQTPGFGSKKLYEISGHWKHYKNEMYPVIDVDGEELVMRPMTCPHHVLIYKNKMRSYRDLPIRYSEQSRLYRYEKSGALLGLERVRSMELTEGHIFARPDQIFQEFKTCYLLIKKALTKFNIQIDYISLSLRDKADKEKFFQNDAMWEKAEKDLHQVLLDLNIEYVEKIGEAAFYGPKIDVQVKSALGHEITLSTLQLDFLIPKRFEMYYVDKNKEKQTPILIHRGLLGTYERFIAILLEQTKGNLPFWLAPRQVTIIPISLENHLLYANKICKKLVEHGIRVHVDNRKERIGKKIRESQISKTKYQIIIGDNEQQEQTISVRTYGSNKITEMTPEEFVLLTSK